MQSENHPTRRKTFTAPVIALILLAAAVTVTVIAAASAHRPPAEAEDDIPLLPDMPDFGGASLTMLTEESHNFEFVSEELNGEAVNDAVFNRLLKVEQELEISVESVTRPGASSKNYDVYCSEVRNSVLAGQGYDLAAGVSGFCHPLAAEGLWLDLIPLPYIDHALKFAVPGLCDSTPGGRLYGLIGGGSLSAVREAYALFINRGMLEILGLDNPAPLVRKGAWILDSMLDYARAAASDLDADGEADPEIDRFGYVAVHSINRAFLGSADCHALVCDGERVVVLPADERMINIYEKVEALTADARVSWVSMGSKTAANAPFTEGRSLFCGASLSYTETLRHSDIDWSVLPYPKYAEYDDCYAGQLPFSAVGLFVPANVSGDGLELSASTITALCHYGSLMVNPVYLENALLGRTARDADTREMLNLAASSVTASYDALWSRLYDTPPHDILDPERVGASFTAFYEKASAKWAVEISMHNGF